MFLINSPPGNKSDCALLASESGTLAGGAGTIHTIGQFTLPQLFFEDRVILLIEAIKSDPLDITPFAYSTNQTAATNTNPSPCYNRPTATHTWIRCELNRSLTGAGYVNYVTRNSSGSVVTGNDNTTWGTVSAAKTIYVNMGDIVGVDISYKWHAWIMKEDIK